MGHEKYKVKIVWNPHALYLCFSISYKIKYYANMSVGEVGMEL